MLHSILRVMGGVLFLFFLAATIGIPASDRGSADSAHPLAASAGVK